MTKLSLLFLLSISQVSCNSDYELSGEKPNINPGEVTECPFSVVSGTQLSSYDCNPVFTNTDEDWGSEIGSVGFFATEVLGHPFYQMWYSSSSTEGFGDFGMGYAVSSNGTD